MARYLNIGFTKQFRRDYIVVTCKNEVVALGKFIAKELIRPKIIWKLIGQLENEDAPDLHRLSGFAQKLLEVFSSSAYDEPYTACYYTRLLAVIKSFLSMINAFEKVQRHLLDILKILSAGIHTGGVVDTGSVSSEDIAELQTVMSLYLDETQRYYDDIDAFLAEEPDNAHAAKVTSQVDHYLLSLLMLIERSMLNAQTTCTRLAAWKKQLARTEVQEIYN